MTISAYVLNLAVRINNVLPTDLSINLPIVDKSELERRVCLELIPSQPSLPKTNMKRENSGNVTGLKFENRIRSQSCTRSTI